VGAHAVSLLRCLAVWTRQRAATAWRRTYIGPVAAEAWTAVDLDQYETYWQPFDAQFRFRPGMNPSTWPAIREPTPSITIDLAPVFENGGAQFASGANAVNALGLYAFTRVIEKDQQLMVLDWQHPCYRFSPHRQSLTSSTWPVTIFPDGDYHAFLTQDLSVGTFGHPWEQTLCVFGEPLIERLGEPLAAMLGVKRRR
jgi:hypothetical protein